jgi:hypothetical protein
VGAGFTAQSPSLREKRLKQAVFTAGLISAIDV